MKIAFWIVTNWDRIAEALFCILAIISFVISRLPESASRNKAVAAAERLSFLVHKDSPGTTKAPGTTGIEKKAE